MLIVADRRRPVRARRAVHSHRRAVGARGRQRVHVRAAGARGQCTGRQGSRRRGPGLPADQQGSAGQNGWRTAGWGPVRRRWHGEAADGGRVPAGLDADLPRPAGLGTWVFAKAAGIAWRRQGPGVQVLEANLRRVLAGSTAPTRWTARNCAPCPGPRCAPTPGTGWRSSGCR